MQHLEERARERGIDIDALVARKSVEPAGDVSLEKRFSRANTKNNIDQGQHSGWCFSWNSRRQNLEHCLHYHSISQMERTRSVSGRESEAI